MINVTTSRVTCKVPYHDPERSDHGSRPQAYVCFHTQLGNSYADAHQCGLNRDLVLGISLP
jgi:hypothetical protein